MTERFPGERDQAEQLEIAVGEPGVEFLRREATGTDPRAFIENLALKIAELPVSRALEASSVLVLPTPYVHNDQAGIEKCQISFYQGTLLAYELAQEFIDGVDLIEEAVNSEIVEVKREIGLLDASWPQLAITSTLENMGIDTYRQHAALDFKPLFDDWRIDTEHLDDKSNNDTVLIAGFGFGIAMMYKANKRYADEAKNVISEAEEYLNGA